MGKTQTTLKHWYLPLISGLIFVGMGFYTFNHPLASYVALSMLFSLSFIFSGLSEIIFALSNKSENRNTGWTLFLGIVTFVIGLSLLANPEISIATLPLYVGFIVLFRSIGSVIHSLDLKKNNSSSWGGFMFMGILGIIFSQFLMHNPTFTGMTIVIWTGIALLTAGILNIFLSFRLKKLVAAS